MRVIVRIYERNFRVVLNHRPTEPPLSLDGDDAAVVGFSQPNRERTIQSCFVLRAACRPKESHVVVVFA